MRTSKATESRRVLRDIKGERKWPLAPVMSESSALHNSLEQAIARRAREGFTIFHVDEPLPSSAPDFFSNNYLSLSTDRFVRDLFLRKIQAAAPDRLLGSTGSHLATGYSVESKVLETAFTKFFGAQSALFFGSGFNANLAFVAFVPQENDVIIHDEFIHASCREGIRLSSHTAYRFTHNSVASFKECLIGVLQKHPQVVRGTSTVFVLLESLYSMDGDFCPLEEMVNLVETIVPAGHAHIVVDEAHTSGVFGPNGKGYISLLGLDDRIHTKVHTFGEGWGFHGAVVLTSSIIKDYMINFAKNVMFSTSMPFTDIYAIEACFSVISSARGQELRQKLHHLSRYARHKLYNALKDVPETILALDNSNDSVVISRPALCSPIIPVFTPHASSLADHLLKKGYGVSPLTYPVVRRPRIRVIIHAVNTEEEIDSFISELLAWAEQQGVLFRSYIGSAGSSAGGAMAQESRSKL